MKKKISKKAPAEKKDLPAWQASDKETKALFAEVDALIRKRVPKGFAPSYMISMVGDPEGQPDRLAINTRMVEVDENFITGLHKDLATKAACCYIKHGDFAAAKATGASPERIAREMASHSSTPETLKAMLGSLEQVLLQARAQAEAHA